MIVYIPGRCWARGIGLGREDLRSYHEIFRSLMLDKAVQWRLQPLHQMVIPVR